MQTQIHAAVIHMIYHQLSETELNKTKKRNNITYIDSESGSAVDKTSKVKT